MSFLKKIFGGNNSDTSPRFPSVTQAKRHFIRYHPDGKLLRQALDEHMSSWNLGNIAESCLPDEYDDTPYSGVVNGHISRTLGEYKAMTDDFYKDRP